MRGHRDLRLACAAAAACGLVALVVPVAAISVLFLAPLAFFLPGYAIVAAVFVRKPLAAPQLLTLSTGLSLAVLALGALVLNYAPGGVSPAGWAILLTLVTVAACQVGAMRRPAADGEPILSLPRPGARQAILVAASALALVAALVLAFTTLPAKKAIGYTELWMQPYAASGSTGVRVGVGSDEQHRTAYRLRVRFGTDGAAAVRNFTLDPGKSTVLRLPTAQQGAGSQRVVAALFRAGLPDHPYRRVSGWTATGRASG